MHTLNTLAPSDFSNRMLDPTVRSSQLKSSNLLRTSAMSQDVVKGVLAGITQYVRGNGTVHREETAEDETAALMKTLDHAGSLDEYQTAAEKLDDIQDNNKWKHERDSCEPEYNPTVIEDHMKELNDARERGDMGAMEHLIRTKLSRDLGGMNVLSLYKHSWAGTKFLVEDYITSVLETIEAFAESAIGFRTSTEEVQFYLKSLEKSLKYFGRSALTLSGGAVLGMKHIGVCKTLWEADILPEIISGSSAGSIIAAVICSSTDDEMAERFESFATTNLACFDAPDIDSSSWFWERVRTYREQGTYFSMEALKRVLQEWMGELTFKEAHYKTHRVLNICVSSADSGEPRLLNHVTAPDVLIWSAVCASCSVPGVFPEANIFEKDPTTKKQKLWMQHAKQMFVDGSLDHDIPMRKLSEMFNVNFFIVCQINPHVRLFLDEEQPFIGNDSEFESTKVIEFDLWKGLCSSKHAIRHQILQFAAQARNFGIPHRFLRWASVFSQQYTGDINILPDIRPEEYAYMLANPNPDYMKLAIFEGQQATWPKIFRIKNCVAIELALIRAIHTLKERVNFGPEARALRLRNSRGGGNRSYNIRGQRPGMSHRRSLSTEIIDQEQLSRFSPLPSPGTPLAALTRFRTVGAVTDRLSGMSNSVSNTEAFRPTTISEFVHMNGNTFADPLSTVSYFPTMSTQADDDERPVARPSVRFLD